MSRPVFIGIDPGFTGALAVIEGRNGEAEFQIHDAPIFDVAGRRQMHVAAMVDILGQWRDAPGRVRVFIERVHSMPGSSGRSMFAFGEGYGIWQGVAGALGYAVERVEPARWKGRMMDGMGKDKDAARFRAALLFPQLAAQFARKQDDGRAEALLIAEYGRRTS
jgi:crossover junction endodeoxyribonuclease RuvC